ncbi:MAG: radical SAM protein [Candidatus Omnitrophica bacterium]|nr:radical SAM protein [Candidatus Omnitrophota bacterium]
MKIALLRLPLGKGITGVEPGGYVTSMLYFQWLTRYPPMGLLYYASLLKKAGHTVRVIDSEMNGSSLRKISRTIKEFGPQVVCSSINVFSPASEFSALKKLKDAFKFTLICRGHFPRIYPEETIQNSHVDFALTGKGLFSIPLLVNAIEQKKDTGNIPGIIYKQGRQIIRTAEEPLVDLNALPFPARELIDNRIYTTALTTADRFTTVIGSLGCPYQCTYCQEKNAPYQTRDVNNIVAEIVECKRKFGINELFFLDPIFTVDRARTMDFCAKLNKSGVRMKWVMRTRADLVDEEMLSLLAGSGCVKIHYGIESGNQRILDGLNRQITLGKVKETVKLTAKKHIAVFGYFMIGNTGETVESIQDTIAFARSLPLNFAQFMKVAPIHYTDVHKRSLDKFKSDIWLEHYKGIPGSADKWKPQDTGLSTKELNAWIRRAYRGFYLRPGYLWRMLTFRYTPFYIIRQLKIAALLLRLRIAGR